MQVICKKNNLIYDNQPHYFASITIGKSYELLNISHNPKFRVYGGELKTLFYEIVEDNSGLSGYYPSQLFYTLEEFRDMRLNQILQKEKFL